MTPTQAKRKMLLPRKLVCRCGGTPGHYYVEEEGISVINENSPGAISFISWRQIDLALALKRSAQGKSEDRAQSATDIQLHGCRQHGRRDCKTC